MSKSKVSPSPGIYEEALKVRIDDRNPKLARWPPSAAMHAVFRKAAMIFDPLLKSDDEKQIRLAAKGFSRRGEEFFNLADALERLVQRRKRLFEKTKA